MIVFNVNNPKLKDELENVVRSFFAEYGLRYSPCKEQAAVIDFEFYLDGSIATCACRIDGKEFTFPSEDLRGFSNGEMRKYINRYAKKSLYEALRAYTGREMSWGSLTGIRPTKPARELLSGGVSRENLAHKMVEIYGVSLQNAELLSSIIEAQNPHLPPKNSLNIYINIPFCHTKCNYCSFPSVEISSVKGGFNAEDYLNALATEIAHMYKMIEGVQVFSCYIGGGTPTALSKAELERVLSSVSRFGREFTLEAGRADSIDEQKLHVAKNSGVTRVCVNPQTLNDKTLSLIGRNHTSAQFIEAYELALSMGFDINLDLIAGLSGESLQDFSHTIEGVLSLSPQNITVHTLALKHGARLMEQKAVLDDDLVSKMVALSRARLAQSGYIPYYLYRQKYMAGNLENIGWTKPNKQCINNISVMEELISVVACGAGGISKFVDSTKGRIERLANPKDIKTYIQKLPLLMQEKERLFALIHR